MGGIGPPQAYFDPSNYVFADNLYVYSYGTFGVLAIAMFYFILRGALGLDIRKSTRDAIFGALILACLAYGVISEIITNVFLSFSLGLCVAPVFGYSLGAGPGKRIANATEHGSIM